MSNTLVGNYNKIESAITGSIASVVESLGATDYAQGIRNRQERFRLRTQAERKQDDFQTNTDQLLSRTNGVLAQGRLADRALSNIACSIFIATEKVRKRSLTVSFATDQIGI